MNFFIIASLFSSLFFSPIIFRVILFVILIWKYYWWMFHTVHICIRVNIHTWSNVIYNFITIEQTLHYTVKLDIKEKNLHTENVSVDAFFYCIGLCETESHYICILSIALVIFSGLSSREHLFGAKNRILNVKSSVSTYSDHLHNIAFTPS